jgi:hypothetical protein
MSRYSHHDEYTDPATGVLKNRLGISDDTTFAQTEAQFVAEHARELTHQPIPGAFDLPHLHAIHLMRVTMNDLSAGTDTVATLYRRAFVEYGTQALWNMRPRENPTPADALAITKALRTHGGMHGRRLAEHIEQVCHAAH